MALKITIQNDDCTVSLTREDDVIVWDEILSLCADVLNGAGYIIDKEILDFHLNKASTEISEGVMNNRKHSPSQPE